MTNKEDVEMSGSEAEKDTEMEQEIAPNGGSGTVGDSDSDGEAIQIQKKRTRKMVIDDDEDASDDGGKETNAEQREEEQEEAMHSHLAPDTTTTRSDDTPATKKNTAVNKKKTVDDVLAAVLKDSDSEGDSEVKKSDADDDTGDESDSESDDGETSQGPVKFTGELFDAEDSSADEGNVNNLDAAAGPGYDSAEDQDFDVSSLDPKLLKKLKKGASKKPREQKSRKCKPTKDDMLELHSESQRLMREAHVRLPYHKPAPKSLQDFVQRAKKKQEVYRELRGARDIEKAQMIQEKIAEPSLMKLPRLNRPERSSQRSDKHSSVADGSQQSLSDSGLSSGGSNLHSQGDDSQRLTTVEESHFVSNTPSSHISDDHLPDLVPNHSDRLCDSQQATKELGNQNSQPTVTAENSQPVSDGDHAFVEEFDSPPPEDSQSQKIEDVKSLSVQDDDSQRSETVASCVPDSLEIESAETNSDNEDNDAHVDYSAVTDSHTSDSKVSCENESSKNNAVSHDELGEPQFNSEDAEQIKRSPSRAEELSNSSKTNVELVSEETRVNNISDNAESVVENSAVSDVSEGNGAPASDKAAVSSLQAARQKAVEELTQKGVVPGIRRPNGQFILLDEEEPQVDCRSKGVQKLMDMLVKQHKKKEPKKPKDVEISIVEKTGEEGNAELRLKSVTYHVNGDQELDLNLEASKHVPGGQLEALKRQLEKGMQKRRAAAFERRKQLYAMENEEGYGNNEVDDGLPEEEEEAELTDQSDTDDEEEEAELEEKEDKERDWNNPFLDEEADEDYDDGDEDEIPQRPVCAEIDDMKDDEDDDLFQDTDQLRLNLSDDEEDSDTGEQEKKVDEENDDDDIESVTLKKSYRHKQLTISDDDEEEEKMDEDKENRELLTDEDSQEKIPSAQDSTKTYNPASAGGESKSLDLSFDLMTPMTRYLQDTQPSSAYRSGLNLPIEDSQDLYGGSESDHNNSLASSAMHTSFSDDPILDSDGYIRIPTTQPRRASTRLSSFLSDGSQDAGAGMDELAGLCSGQFAGQNAGAGMDELAGLCSGQFSKSDQNAGAGMDELVGLCSGQFAGSGGPQGSQRDTPPSGGFGGLFDNSSQSQGDRSSVASLFSSDSVTNRESQQQGDDMDDLLGLCSGQFKASSSSEPERSQATEKRKSVKRRLITRDDSSDEEGDELGTGSFKLLSNEEASRDSDMNELSGTDDEKDDNDSDTAEAHPSFKNLKSKGQLLQQFVEDEAELSGSEADSDENLDIAEEDDYLEMEVGDNDVTLNEEQLRDQVGRVHMKQVLDDDDRELMRYKEMYLPDGDLHSEGSGRQRRFIWSNMGDEGSQQDMFADGSDEEKEAVEDPDEKQWRMERFEREKFLESQQQEVAGEEDDNSQFLKFGKTFMKKQVSEPSVMTPEKTSSFLKPKTLRSMSLVEKSSPGKFVKPKVPQRGSFLTRSKENLARIAEITKSAAVNVKQRGSRNFVFSVNSEKGDDDDGGGEKLMNKAASEGTTGPAVKKRVAHKPPPKKKQCVEPPAKPKAQTQKSIFKHFDK